MNFNQLTNHPLFVIPSIPLALYGLLEILPRMGESLYIDNLIVITVFLTINSLWGICTIIFGNRRTRSRPVKNLVMTIAMTGTPLYIMHLNDTLNYIQGYQALLTGLSFLFLLFVDIGTVSHEENDAHPA